METKNSPVIVSPFLLSVLQSEDENSFFHFSLFVSNFVQAQVQADKRTLDNSEERERMNEGESKFTGVWITINLMYQRNGTSTGN